MYIFFLLALLIPCVVATCPCGDNVCSNRATTCLNLQDPSSCLFMCSQFTCEWGCGTYANTCTCYEKIDNQRVIRDRYKTILQSIPDTCIPRENSVSFVANHTNSENVACDRVTVPRVTAVDSCHAPINTTLQSRDIMVNEVVFTYMAYNSTYTLSIPCKYPVTCNVGLTDNMARDLRQTIVWQGRNPICAENAIIVYNPFDPCMDDRQTIQSIQLGCKDTVCVSFNLSSIPITVPLPAAPPGYIVECNNTIMTSCAMDHNISIATLNMSNRMVNVEQHIIMTDTRAPQVGILQFNICAPNVGSRQLLLGGVGAAIKLLLVPDVCDMDIRIRIVCDTCDTVDSTGLIHAKTGVHILIMHIADTCYNENAFRIVLTIPAANDCIASSGTKTRIQTTTIASDNHDNLSTVEFAIQQVDIVQIRRFSALYKLGNSVPLIK